MEYNSGNVPPLLLSQRQYLVARSTETTTTTSSLPSSTSKSSISVTSIAIPVAVGGPALLVALFLGYFLIKNYKMNKKEEKEFLADPNFAPDEQGLPDYPIPKNVQRQNTKIKPSSGTLSPSKFKRNIKETNDTVSLPFEGEFSNDHQLHEYVRNFGDGLSPYTAIKYPLTESTSTLSNSTRLASPYAKDKVNSEFPSGSNLDGSTLNSISNASSPPHSKPDVHNSSDSPLKNEAYRNSVISKHSLVGETNPYSAYQGSSTTQLPVVDTKINNSNSSIPFPPPVAKSSIKPNEYMNPYLENPYAINNSGSEISPYNVNEYSTSSESNYNDVEPIKDVSFAETADEMDEETSERLKSVYNMYFERMSRSNTLRAPNMSNKAPPIPPAPSQPLDLQNLRSSPDSFSKNNMNQTSEANIYQNSISRIDKPLPEDPKDHRDSEISTNSIFKDMAKSETASGLYASTYLEPENAYNSTASTIQNAYSTDNYHKISLVSQNSPTENNSHSYEQENFTANENIQHYPTHNQQTASSQNMSTNQYSAAANGYEYSLGNNENNQFNNYGNSEQNYVNNNGTYRYENYGNYNGDNSYKNYTSYNNSHNNTNYSGQHEIPNGYGTNYAATTYNSDSSFAVNGSGSSVQKQLAPPAPIYDMNAGLVSGPNKVPTPADVARQSISMLNTVGLKSTKKYKPAASSSSRMMTPQYNMPTQNQSQAPSYHQPKYLVSNAKRRNPNDLRKKLNVDAAFF